MFDLWGTKSDKFPQNSQSSLPGLQNSASGFPSLLPRVFIFEPFPPESILTLLFPKHTGRVLDLAHLFSSDLFSEMLFPKIPLGLT